MTRICFVFNHFQLLDGICRSAVATANHLAERSDVEVTLISLYKFHKDVNKFLNPRIKVINIFGLYFRGLSKITNSKFLSKWIYKKYVEGKYDIEIPYQAGLPYKIVNSITKPNNVRRIGWIHIYHNNAVNDYKKMDLLVSVSREGAKKALEDIANNVNVTYCYNPIDDINVVNLGSESIELKRTDNNLQFVSVGRISPEKGYKRLVTIFEKLKNNGYNPQLWIVGDGPERLEIESMVEQKGLISNIVLVGPKSNPHAYTSKSDVFICSSFIEGYSTACTEALMLGIPVISTNVCGAEEIITDAECGLLCDMDDESLYKAIKTVLDKPEIVSKWKETLNKTKAKFSAEVRLNQLYNILKLPK